jgi:hypothetical protein
MGTLLAAPPSSMIAIQESSPRAKSQEDTLSAPRVTTRARIFKLLSAPGIDSKESISPAYVAWRAGMNTLLYFKSVPSPHRLLKNSSTVPTRFHMYIEQRKILYMKC